MPPVKKTMAESAAKTTSKPVAKKATVTKTVVKKKQLPKRQQHRLLKQRQNLL